MRTLPPMHVEVVTETPSGWLVVALRGDLDLAGLPVLRSRLGAVAPGDRGVVIDLDPVDLLEAESLGVFLGLAARLRRTGRDLRLVSSIDRHLELFELTGVDRALAVHGSIVDATDD